MNTRHTNVRTSVALMLAFATLAGCAAKVPTVQIAEASTNNNGPMAKATQGSEDDIMTEEDFFQLNMMLHNECAGDNSSEEKQTFCFCVARTIINNIKAHEFRHASEIIINKDKLAPSPIQLDVCIAEAGGVKINKR